MSVAVIARDRHAGDYLHAPAGSGDDGRPALVWHFDQAATDAEAATDGWYALLTNLDAQTVPASQVLARYKQQAGTSERRYHDLKGPLAVAPMFLHANRRIAAIIGVVCMALLIYCLAGRHARRSLAPDTTLATLRLRTRTYDGTAEIPQPDPLQQRLLDLLEIDPPAASGPTQPHVRITGLAAVGPGLRAGTLSRRDSGRPNDVPERCGLAGCLAL